MLVKRIRSKLYEWRNIIGMVVWDVMLGAALVFFLYVALMNVSSTSLRIALMAFTVAIIAFSIVVKYVLFYQKTGVDDITGALPEEKINGNLRELHGFCCREAESLPLFMQILIVSNWLMNYMAMKKVIECCARFIK